jgi:[histone H3]-lysine36 N-dimethyltransferase SETMAR
VYTLNSDVYLEQLNRLEAAIQSKKPRKKNHIIFHHDNAGSHIEERVVNSIKEKGWEILPHPPYSPKEAPTDYHVNRSISKWQQRQVFESLDDLVANIKA